MNTKDFEVTKDLQLNSITHGKVSLEETVKYIVDYLSADKQAKYEIAIGTDSMTRSQTKFALAIVVHRNTNGCAILPRASIMVSEQVRLLRWFEKPKNVVQLHKKPLLKYLCSSTVE